MTASPLQAPYCTFFDSNGDPLSGGKVYTYTAGTTTPKNSYTSSSGLIANTNPVILDSAGRADIYLIGSYRIDVYTSTDSLVESVDNLTAFSTGGNMDADVYDPANIAQQLVGTTAVQTLTNKTIPLVGTTTNDNAASGIVGEYIEGAVAFGSAVSLVNATGKNLSSVSLTAGDWDVDIIFQFTGNSSTTVQALGGTLSTTSNTLTTTNGWGGYQSYAGGTPFNVANPTVFAIPRIRVSIASTTTYYAVAYCQFAVSTASVYGMINARRVR